jgi:hypothetical protein
MTNRGCDDSLSFLAVWKVASSIQIVVDGFWSMTCYHLTIALCLFSFDLLVSLISGWFTCPDYESCVLMLLLLSTILNLHEYY